VLTFLVAWFATVQIALAAPLSIQEAWSGISDPLLMGNHLELRFFKLPMQGTAAQGTKFWSGDYWAINKGLINHRWNASRHFTMGPPSREQLMRISAQEISQLSPAEKFDLLNGRYDYPLHREVKKYSNPDAKNWEGICHGWAPASMNHQEPQPKTLINPDGVPIAFGSADIKALISYYYAYPYQVNNTHQVGRRCEHGRVTTDDECQQDLNAGAFHIILANKIGMEKKGFIADMDRYKEVWNHPIISYSSEITNEGGDRMRSAPGTFRTVRVRTKIRYANETTNYWHVTSGTNQQSIKDATFEYVLEIDRNGEIIGGMWRSVRRPDFLWLKVSPQIFYGDYARLAELLND
jgi:hypothetical protein